MSHEGCRRRCLRQELYATPFAPVVLALLGILKGEADMCVQMMADIPRLAL